MTLIIAAGNSDQFIQISDRRLSSNGKIIEEEANKAFVLNCSNARLSVGYTGLANAESFSTRDWLLSTINECGPPDYTAKNIILRFTERASKEYSENPIIKRLSKVHSRLTVMFTGYLYHHEPPLGALAVVSNFQNLNTGTIEQEANEKFDYFFRVERRPNKKDIALFYVI